MNEMQMDTAYVVWNWPIVFAVAVAVAILIALYVLNVLKNKKRK